MILAVTTIQHPTHVVLWGAASFGLVVGYITYRTLARTTETAAITDLATVIGAIGGGTIMTIYGPSNGALFAMYSFGLLVGMVVYLILSVVFSGKESTGTVLGSDKPR